MNGAQQPKDQPENQVKEVRYGFLMFILTELAAILLGVFIGHYLWQ